jgi:YD repeat-containing protein
MVAIFTGSGFGFERGSASVLGGSGLLGSAVQGWGGEGVFVNGASGNLLLQKQDEFLVGKGPDVGIGRTYNSLTSLADDNDDKWRQSTDRRVYGMTGTLGTSGSTVKRVSGDGTEITYTWDTGVSAYVTKDGGGAYDRIVRDGSEWVWTDGDSQGVERYYASGTGKIKSVTDINGSALTFAYDGSDRLTTVTSSDGSWTRYDYSGSTNDITQVVTGYTDLATSTAKTLTRTRYGYDGSHRLTTVTTDLTPSDNSVSDGATYVTTYTYDGSGRISNIAQSDGSNLGVTYDGSNRVATLVQTETTGVTRTTSFTYNTLYTTVTDPSGQVTRLDYDASGNLTKITAPPAYSGASQQIVQFAYNGSGDLTSTTDGLGNVTAFSSFTANGLAQTVTDRLSNSVTRTYSATNQLLSETRTGVDASGSAVSQISRYVYNTAGNLRFAISAEGRVTEYTRDAAGQMTYETVYAEAAYTTAGTPSEANMTTWVGGLSDKSWVQKTKYLYDARGAVTSATSYGIANSGGTEQTSEGTSVTSFVYDQAGQLLSSYSGANTATTYVYDGMGRMTSTTDANGGTTTIAFNAGALTTTITLASGYVTTKTYNKAGDLVSVTDSGANTTGGTTAYAYDKLGRVRVRTDANGLKTYTIHDDAGRLVGTVDHAGALTEYRYDANNRLVGTVQYRSAVSAGTLTTLNTPTTSVAMASIRPAANAEDVSSWTVYDAEGRVLQTIAGDGSTTISSYDAAGRLQKTTAYTNKIAQATVDGYVTTPPSAVVTPATSGTDTVARVFYDKDGLVIGSLSGEGYLTQNIYDKAGQLTATTAYATKATGTLATDSFTTLLASVGTSAQDRTSRLVYDGQGLLRYTVDALNQVVRYDYDTAGNKVRTAVYAAALGATSDYTFDNVKSLATSLESSSAKRESWGIYDAAGRLAFGIDTAGAVTGYTYDSSGRVTKVVQYEDLRATTSLPAVATMTTWAAGNASDAGNRVTRTWYTARGEAAYVVDAEGYASLTAYDAAGQATSVKRYDAVITVSDSTTFAQVTTAIGAGVYTTTSFEYDSLGRLTATVDPLGSRTTYAYLGASSLKTVVTRAATGTAQEQAVTHVIYDHAGRAVQTVDGEGTAEAATSTATFDGRGNLATSVDPRTKTTTYTYDLDGRVKTVTDAASGVTTYDYNAFGEVWKTTDPNGNISYSWYDKLGRATTSRDAANYLTHTTYTVFGEVGSVKRWMTAISSTPAMGTEPTGSGTSATTSFTYDARSQVLTSTDALSNAESYTYDAFGNRITSTGKLGAVTSYAYDKLDRLVRQGVAAATTNYTAATGSGTAGSYIVTTYAYTAHAQTVVQGYAAAALTGTVTALRTTTSTYDAAGQLTTVGHDAVTTIADDMVTTTGSVAVTETYAYDKRGNVIKAVDAGGAQTFSYYDDLDRKTVEIRQLAANAWVYTAYTYDANGNLTGTRVYAGNPYSSGSPPLGGTAPATPTSPTSAYRETTFTYDNLNRMLTSSVVGAADAIVSGYWNGSAYTTNAGAGASAQALTTSYQYDADGNVVKLTSPNGGITWSWYDARGQKIAQADGEQYLTRWTYDAEGNVLSETRYATKFTGTLALGTVPSVSTNAADRITDFEYDLAGNRTKETRRNVAAWDVNATTGALTAAGTTDSVIQYTYNALGQVTVKQISGSTVAGYTYDATGRLTTETRGAFTDANGSSVTPTTNYAYDAIGDLVGTTQAGTASGTFTSADRTTTYRYGQGGRLLSTTDAEGYVQTYFYDAAGRLKKTGYDRVINADTTLTGSTTSTVTEARSTTYDLAGRALTQGVYSTISGTLTRVDFASFEYNNYDQVTRQGSGANSSGAMFQAENQYDAAGRLVATNAGDGIWKVFSYNKDGNQTGAITSAGYATSSSSTFAALFASVSGNTLNGTYTAYSWRGEASQVIEEGRDLSASVTNQALNTYRTYNAFGEIASETNALGNSVTYSYNTMGRKIRSESPAVQITDETGAAYWVKPSEDYYYDLGGRMIASRDASEGAAGANYAHTGSSAGTATAKTANTGNLTTYAYLGGSGLDGSQALIATEFHADGGKKQILYDRMGDARVVRDELYSSANPNLHQEERTYNKLGQLTQVKHNRVTDVSTDSTRLIDNYAYDQFGQRIQHTNNFAVGTLYGTPVWTYSSFYLEGYGWISGYYWDTPVIGNGSANEKAAYDALGRIIAQTDFLGNAATTTYTWDGSLNTNLGGTNVNLGGWVEAKNYAWSKNSTSKTDIYGREVYKSDLGAHVTTAAFDAGARLTSRTTGSTTQSFQWYNTGLIKQNVSTSGTETYTYDAVGNRLTEKLVNGGVTFVDAQATYDALGRLTWWNQNAATYANSVSTYTTPQTTNAYYYDASGNVRREATTYKTIDAHGTASASATTINYWYRYDAMNRVIVDRGLLSGTAGASGTTIVRGVASGGGQALVYDLAGQRIAVLRTDYVPPSVTGYWDFYTNQFVLTGYSPGYSQESRENYDYDGAGRIVSIRTTQGSGAADVYDPVTGLFGPATSLPAASSSGGVQRSAFTYDLMNRQTAQSDYDAAGTTVVFSRTASYDLAGKLTVDISNTRRGSDTYRAYTSNNYNMLGAVDYSSTTNSKNNTYLNETTSTTTYQWWDGAVQGTIAYTQSSGTTNTTFTYDGLGRLTWVYVGDGRPRNIGFRTNGDGQIIRRDELDNNNTNGDPHEAWYRFDGRQLGYIGNNGTTNMSLAASIADRQATGGSGAFRNGATYATTQVDTTGNYDAINSYRQGSGAGSYTVQRTGETLAGIAQALWGDSSLWYKLAEANGMSADAGLVEGQRLTVPSGVIRNTFNAGTVKPYDPASAIGDVTPSTPLPPAKKKGCGIIGMIFLAIIAIAVAVLVPYAIPALKPAALGGGVLGTVASGAISGAIGSVVSQGVGIATGLQDGFSWKGVALGALGGAVGGALKGLEVFGKAGLGGLTNAANDLARGALQSTITQGIGVATGLQDKFSWAGVAASGIGSMVGGIVGRTLDIKPLVGEGSSQSLGNIAGNALAGGAALLANAATRSAIDGSNFGDNIMAALPDTIANTIGNLAADRISRGPRLSYGDVGSDDGVTGGSGTTGAGDGTQARPVAGVAGGGQVGGSASGDAQLGDIVVTADRRMSLLFHTMNDYQFGRYQQQYGDTSFEKGAMWALGLTAPAVTSSFGPVSSYDSPLIQSLKTARPYGLYSDGPTQQYMLGDGSVFTGTPSALDRFKQQRAAQADMVYMNRITGSTIGGIALGVANGMGASPATQNLVYGLGSSADGLLLSGAALRGGSIGPFTGQNSLNIVNGENGVHANSRLSGRTTYLYELQNKDGQFLKYGISVNPSTRYSSSFMRDKDIFPITSGTRSDMMALERQMVVSNPGPLNNEPWAVKARGGN